MSEANEEFVWEEIWHSDDGNLPNLGQFIQLRLGNIHTHETVVCEGTVVKVVNEGEKQRIKLIPEIKDHVAPNWGWVEWRGRIVRMTNDEEVGGHAPT